MLPIPGLEAPKELSPIQLLPVEVQQQLAKLEQSYLHEIAEITREYEQQKASRRRAYQNDCQATIDAAAKGPSK